MPSGHKGTGPYANTYRKEWSKQLRLISIQKYGGKCACCGETQIKFLGIDHIEGNGTQHRKKIREEGHTTHTWLRKYNYPEGFQVLCHNCNLAKGFYGICPHKEGT